MEELFIQVIAELKMSDFTYLDEETAKKFAKNMIARPKDHMIPVNYCLKAMEAAYNKAINKIS